MQCLIFSKLWGRGGSTGWAVAHPEIGKKLFRVVFSAHRRTPAPTGAAELLLPAASRASCHPAPCSCSAASRLAPAGRRRPPLGRLGAFPAPTAVCRPPVSATRPTLPVHLRPPVSWCRAVDLDHHPTLPSGPSDGPASLLGSARRRLRPPSLLDAAAPPSLPGSLLRARRLRARLPPGPVCRGAGHRPPCPPGQWRLPARPAPLLPWLQCSVRLCRLLCFLLKFDLS
jgi:hypothetical protein